MMARLSSRITWIWRGSLPTVAAIASASAARRHIVQPDQTPFRLADDLLRHHEDVARVQRFTLGEQTIHNQRGQVIAGPDQGEILDGKERHCGRHATPRF